MWAHRAQKTLIDSTQSVSEIEMGPGCARVGKQRVSRRGGERTAACFDQEVVPCSRGGCHGVEVDV